LAAIVALFVVATVRANQQTFEWSSTTGTLSSEHKEAIESITGQAATSVMTPVGERWIVPGNMSGTFTYDPDNVISTEPRANALAYKGPNRDWTSELHNQGGLVGTYTGTIGEVIAGNGDDAPGGPDDLVNVRACGGACGDGTGFSVGPWLATGSSVVWIGEGFTEDQTLPLLLPPVGAPAPLALFSFFNTETGENVNIITINVEIGSAVQLVDIDVKPGDSDNCLNVNGHGVIPVAILGSDSLDVASIDASSLSFGGLQVRVRGNSNPQCSIDYANDDAYPDLVCQFVDDSSAWAEGNDEASLTGSLMDGTDFAGADSICMVP
jgi:hypothetical protein